MLKFLVGDTIFFSEYKIGFEDESKGIYVDRYNL